ncbi:hypothetical protein PYCC9005_001792 [Savitreella phatthalungensis]
MTSSGVKLRAARPTDAQDVTQAWYDAFGDSHLNRWWLEGADHESFKRKFARSQRLDIIRGETEFLVAELPDLPFAGYCQFTTVFADGRTASPVQRSLFERLLRSCHAWWQSTIDFFHDTLRGKAACKRNAVALQRYHLIGAVLRSNFPILKQLEPPVGTFTYVSWLAVRPEAQGRGVGKAMLEHGMSRGLPLFLESSEAGYPVYMHVGFEDLNVPTIIRDEDGAVVEELPSLLWRPTSGICRGGSTSTGSSTCRDAKHNIDYDKETLN